MLTRHVVALKLSHESQDVPGGVLSAENVVLPLLDGREVRLCGCALQEVGEILVKHIFGPLNNKKAIKSYSKAFSRWEKGISGIKIHLFINKYAY